MRLIGLDVGEKRIGVAKADSSVRIAVPVGAVMVDGKEIDTLVRYIGINNADVVIVGMPRNLKGEKTKQSEYIKNFVKILNKTLVAKKPNNKTVKIFFQDESLTSVEAKNRLKAKNPDKKSGTIDSEAAAIILQDFLENLTARLQNRQNPSKNAPQSLPEASGAPNSENLANGQVSSETPSKSPKRPQFEPHQKSSQKKWAVLRVLIIIAFLGSILAFSGFSWYKNSLKSPVSQEECSSAVAEENAEACASKQIEIPEGSTLSSIADILKENNIIKSSLSFKLYAKSKNKDSALKAGIYQISPSISIDKLLETLENGSNSKIVFRFTALPGETLNDIKKRLISISYKPEEIDAAFAKNYNHPVLADKPEDASLEGYLFGETYEFYLTDSVETIVIRMLDELYSVVQQNNLKQKFNNLGLTLHEGIILASIVQKEAGTLSKEEMSNVSRVFINRLNSGMSLGSDVTVKYAVDQVDPDRKIYTDNASALEIDSCYNTRKNAGLPCGPISNPSALALISTANPSDNPYLYFLTGDDGLMYYSSTESEHNQNIVSHCQKLCNVSL